MKRSYFKLLWVAIAFLVTTANSSLFAQAPTYSGGTGTQADPFMISTPQDLLALSITEAEEHWVENTYFKLTNDIDMDGITGMLSIGYEYKVDGVTQIAQFKGKFDGNYHVIHNLSITESRSANVLVGHGLFGSTLRAEVKNLGLVNPYIKVVAERVGAILGNAAQTTMENCFIMGGSIEGQTKVGGIMGKPNWGTIVKNCFSSVEIRARYIKNAGIFGDIDNVTETCLFENLVFYGGFGTSELWGNETQGNPGFGFKASGAGYIHIEDTEVTKNIYTIIQGTPDYSTVNVKLPSEFTQQATYAGFDFTEVTGQWVMKENSFAVLKGFNNAIYSGLPTFSALPLQVVASDNSPITNAIVTINDEEYLTNAEGQIDELFLPGNYDFTITKDGYQAYSGSINTENEEMSYVVLLGTGETTYNVSLQFMDVDRNPIEGVSVTITDNGFFSTTLSTNSEGVISLNNLLAKEYSYTATKYLFLDKTSGFTVTQNEILSITLAKDNRPPVANAGLSRTARSGELVTLDASLSTDPNGDEIFYHWEPVNHSLNYISSTGIQSNQHFYCS